VENDRWRPLLGALNDLLPNLAIASLAMDPTNSNVIYAGTGEVYPGDGVRGAGIFKTTDGGANWTHLTGTQNSEFYYVNKLVVSKNGTHNVYAATWTGIWRSTDGGTTWTQVHTAAGGIGCGDLAGRTDTAQDMLFAACTVVNGSTGLLETAIFRNLDAGGAGTWQQVYTENYMGRTSLAIAPSNQSVIYALAASLEAGSYYYGLRAVFRSTSNGAAGTWTTQVRNNNAVKLNTMLLTNLTFAASGFCLGNPPTMYNQGWYDNVIAVDPTDSNRVWAGGVDLYRSNDGGANWGIASYWNATGNSQYAHADHHAIVFHPSYNGTTNKTMFSGNDGGVFRTIDATASMTTGSAGQTALCSGGINQVSWQGINSNFGVTQFYHGLPYPDGVTYFGGTQDNGTVRGTEATGIQGWSRIYDGDGGYVAIDPSNTSVVYASTQNWRIAKSTNGGQNFSEALNGILGSGDTGLFITPFVMDPSNASRLWTGGSYLWRTVDGAANWQKASTLLSGKVSAIAVSPTNPNHVLVGTQYGSIYRSTSALSAGNGTTWASAFPQGGYVSSLAFDPTNDNIAYATYSNFETQHVWRTTDGGATWAAIDGSGTTKLPDIPAHSIVIDPVRPARLYLGTDLGVFISRNSGLTWSVENTGFPNTVTESLSMKAANPATLYAFTHGRGAWRVPTAPCDTPTFTDVPSTHWAYQQIEMIADAGITVGCSTGRYCPENLVTRAEMAAFLVRAKHGPGFLPPPATGIFSDVPASFWAAAFIEQLRADAITTGCATSPLRYCPDANVSRTEMAIFLLRLRHGASYTPPPATGTVFADVPANYWGAAWIEQLKAENLTGGCRTENGLLYYCPASALSRAEMAVFLARERGLTFCQN
jgi:hypothetical protein